MNFKNINWKNFLFLDIPILLLGINYIFYNVLQEEEFKTIFRIASMFFFVAGYLFKEKLTIKSKEIILLFFLTIALFINGGMILNFIAIVLFVVCTTNSINLIIEHVCKINCFLTFVIFILLTLGMTNDVIYLSSNGRLRHALGFNHPNAAALFYTANILLLAIYIRKINLLIVSAIVSYIIFYYTDSRTSFLAIMFFLILESINIFLERKNKKTYQIILAKISMIVIDVLFTFSFLSVFFINKLLFLDELLSYRISIASAMANKSGLYGLIFGGTSDWADNFYYMLLFQYGIIVYICVAIITHLSIKKLIDRKNLRYIPLLTSIFVLATMESSLIRPEILIMLVTWKIIFRA